MKLKHRVSLSGTATCGLIGLVAISAMVLSHISTTYAYVTDITVSVPASCTFSAGGGTYNGSINGGNSTEMEGNAITTSCNDASGYAIYAIGYSGDSYTTNNTDLIASIGSSYNIKTDGSGITNSNWQMKLTPGNGGGATIDNSYNSYRNIPSGFTKVASYTSNVTAGTITPTYKVTVAGAQPAGTYTGKVKYTLVHPNNAAAPEIPKTYMQNMTIADCPTTPTVVYDSRGGEQAYMVARLNDGKCWMLQNLNLPGGTTLSADDTDVTSTYIDGFTTQGNLTKSGNTIVLPASATRNGSSTSLTDSTQFLNASNAYVFNSGNNTTTCNSSTPCNSYYSWIAATLGGKQANGSTAQTGNNADAAASICPKGWRLPRSRTTSATNWQTVSDFYALAHQYGLDSTTSTSESDNGFYTQAGPGTLPNLLLAGLYYNGSFSNGGSYGYYWSATSSDSSYAYFLAFGSGRVGSAGYNARSLGASVRCLLSE